VKAFADGNMLCITKDDFVNLQESPAVFIPLNCENARIIQRSGFHGLAIEDLIFIRNELEAKRAEMEYMTYENVCRGCSYFQSCPGWILVPDDWNCNLRRLTSCCSRPPTRAANNEGKLLNQPGGESSATSTGGG
jgi:hypothetical protein